MNRPFLALRARSCRVESVISGLPAAESLRASRLSGIAGRRSFRDALAAYVNRAPGVVEADAGLGVRSGCFGVAWSRWFGRARG